MTIKRKCLPANVLEMISNTLGDTSQGLTGSEIHHFLLQANIDDLDATNTKRCRLYNAFANEQNKNKCSNQILNFIGYVLAPSRFVNNKEDFERLRNAVNQQLAFVGYELKADGQYREIKVASTISDVQIKVDGFKAKLKEQGAHQLVFSYCNAELIANNYFHAVLESSKGLVKRIQALADVTYDGQNLMEKVFKDDAPILIVNHFQSKSEKDEHSGFRNLLIGIVAMFRNPASHELKVEWNMSEQDALDILAMISYCHRRLDNAHKIR